MPQMSYDPEALTDTAAVILLHSTKGTRTRTATEIAGFTPEDLSSERYRKRVERKRDRLRGGDHPTAVTLISTSGSITEQSTLAEVSLSWKYCGYDGFSRQHYGTLLLVTHLTDTLWFITQSTYSYEYSRFIWEPAVFICYSRYLHNMDILPSHLLRWC